MIKEKQVDILKTLKPKELEAIEDKSDDNEKHLKYKGVFNVLSNERIVWIYNINKGNNLIISLIILKAQILHQYILLTLEVQCIFITK